jgi:TonB family protein
MSFAVRTLCFTALFWAMAFSQSQKRTAAPPSASPSPSPAVVELPKQPTDKIPRKTAPEPDKSASASSPARAEGGIEILSDTMGVDFGPYLQKLKQAVQQHWDPLIPPSAMRPELKSGMAVIRFAVIRDGRVVNTRVEQSSGDVALDRAAYGALIYSSPLPVLPLAFKGDVLQIRARFFYNPTKEQAKKETEHGQERDKPKADPRPKILRILSAAGCG